jgi:uncharacterized membrane protein
MVINRSESPFKFFSYEEKQRIIQAIRHAEKSTSGEIRVHLEKKAGKNPMDRAKKVFYKIGIHKTAMKNGVLIFVATADHQFVILGDQGVNKTVPDGFWDDIVKEMSALFRSGQFCQGICNAIESIGENLKQYFPYQSDDENELSDDLSIKEN